MLCMIQGAHGRAPYKLLIKQGLWAHSRAPLQALIKIKLGLRPARCLLGDTHSTPISVSQKLQELALLLSSQLEKHQGNRTKIFTLTLDRFRSHHPSHHIHSL